MIGNEFESHPFWVMFRLAREDCGCCAASAAAADLFRRIATLEHVAAGNKRHVQLIVPDLERAARQRDQLAALVPDFIQPADDACWYDHHGYCQAHGWTATEPRCPHARAVQPQRPPGRPGDARSG